ncbi:Cyclin-L2 isoform 1 [Schistosoma japonicum]|uniref:Cyclin-L2 isoform 1 n=3 Tax=Schistosoma japonicum TaxID=6182 RepID=A0A4Z2DP89_SCHJA|nr:Cyclin-L2 isoform 1 [Schistosoma japonicum]
MAAEINSRFTKPSDSVWEYCGVNLTIHNIIIPEERLFPTPSQMDKMDYETEIDLRIVGCELIQDSGVLLRLPQVAMATAQVLYQRFFYSKSFVRHFYEHYAMACIFLAAKLEESPRRIRDVINVFHHIRQVREKKTPTPVILDQSYSNLKNQVIKAERRVLKELGFCVHAKHPHKLVICYLQALDHETNKNLVQTAWNYMNDSLRTDIFVRYLPEAIACGCIYLASCKLNIPLPRHPAWWEMFSVSEESVHEIALCLLRLYARPKADVSKLESILAQLRKSQVEAKERENELKKQQTVTTPPSSRSDHSFGCISPPNHLSKLKNQSNGNKKLVNIKTESEDTNTVFSSSSLLASALANAKAVAATIAASKSGMVTDELSKFGADPSTVLDKHEPIEEVSSESPKKLIELNQIDNMTCDTSYKKPNKIEQENCETKRRPIIRPAAYSNISSSHIGSEKRRRHRHKYSSKKHHYNSISPSSSSSDRETDQNRHNSITLLTNNFKPRNYRQKVNDISSSGSETGDSSSSPNRHIVTVHDHRKSKRKHIPRSSSEDSRTSFSDEPHLSPTHYNPEKTKTSRRRLSPPYAYRIDYEKPHKSKHRSSMRSAPNGECGRILHEHSNHRLVPSRHRDHRRNFMSINFFTGCLYGVNGRLFTRLQ